MPYIKKKAPFSELGRLIKGYDGTATVLADKLDCCYNTAASRLRDPGDLTLNDLKKISQRLHIPIEEMRQAIVW